VGTFWEQVFLPQSGSHAERNTYENNQPTGFLPPVIAYLTNGTDSRNIGASGVVTFTTTASHPFRKGGMVTIAGVGNASFNGTFDIASVVPGSPDPQISTQFTVVQAGADATSGGGTATTQNIGGAITGGCFYDGTAFPAAYRGNYFFGDYNSGRMMRVILDAMNQPSRVEEFANSLGSHVDMTAGPDGALYYANQSSPGTIRRCAYIGAALPQNIIIQPTVFNVLEGGSSIFSVRLRSAPAGDVTVTTSRFSGDTDLTVSSGASLVFTPANFNVAQLVTIAAAADADTVNDSAVFRVTAPAIATYDLTVNGIDTPPPPLSVVSRKIHGAAGTLDINLPLTGSPGVECRSGGATGDYQLVITFANTVTVNGTVQARVTSGVGDVGTGGVPNGGAVSVNGAVVTAPLTNIANAQTIGNRTVNSSDISETKAVSGAAVTSGTFRNDVTVNGVINTSDISLVKSKSGTALPAIKLKQKRISSRHRAFSPCEINRNPGKHDNDANA
jgi:hypothetical protein